MTSRGYAEAILGAVGGAVAGGVVGWALADATVTTDPEAGLGNIAVGFLFFMLVAAVAATGAVVGCYLWLRRRGHREAALTATYLAAVLAVVVVLVGWTLVLPFVAVPPSAPLARRMAVHRVP